VVYDPSAVAERFLEVDNVRVVSDPIRVVFTRGS
jgi:hypothetical protein